MSKEFGQTKGAHYISAFRAFVTDSGMPGVTLTKDDGSNIDVAFSLPGIQELQKQLAKAQDLALSMSASQKSH